MKLSAFEIFKYLPASKKLDCSNCQKCGYSSCMEFAMKLLKDNQIISKCPYTDENLKNIFGEVKQNYQNEVELGLINKVKIGGEKVLFRHEKSFQNQTALIVSINTDDIDFNKKLNRVLNFKISKLSQKYKVDGILLKGSKATNKLRLKIEKNGISTIVEEDLKQLIKVKENEKFSNTVEELYKIRRNVILNGDKEFLNPTYIVLKHQDDLLKITSRASYYICKYANMLIFEDFDEAMFSTLIALRQSIFTNPQQPLQVEPKIYEFHNVNENSIVFLTTNFTLTYYAIANELEALDIPSYLIVVPTNGMSVLAAWASEKITTKVVAETIDKFKLREKVKTREIVIPGLLAPMQEELQKEIPDFKIIVGTNAAYLTKDFVKTYKIKNFAK